MKLIMEAIWSSVLVKHGLVTSKDDRQEMIKESGVQQESDDEQKKAKVVRRLEYGDKEEGTPIVEEGAPIVEEDTRPLEEAYVAEVGKKVQQAKSHVSEIFPLHYRLEVLENIFSLLFISNEDLKKTDHCLPVIGDSNKSSASKSTSDAESDVLNSAHSLTFIRKQQGFLMSERLALDLLTLLNDAIFELTATKFALLNTTSSNNDSSQLDESISSVIISSIHPSILQQRLAKLQKYINEAKWRLHLVSSKGGIVSGTKDLMVADYMSSGEESLSDISDTEDMLEPDGNIEYHRNKTKDIVKSLGGSSKGSSPVSGRSRTSSRGIVRTPSGFTDNSSSHKELKTVTTTTTTNGDSSGHCADNEDRSPILKASKDSKRTRKVRSSRSESSLRPRKLGPYQKSSGIICQMLASPESLLCKCLKHCNYNRAREVLKMFNMEGELGDQLVQFAEQFERVGQELKVNSKLSTPHPSPSSTTPITSDVAISLPYSTTPQDMGGADKGINLSVVQAAIIAAQNTLPNMGPLHRLLAPSDIHNIVFAGNRTLAYNSLDLPLINTLLDNTPSLIMLDVLTSSRIEGQTAKNIINKAVIRSKDVLEALSPKIGDSHSGGRRSFQERKAGVGLEKPLLGPLGFLHTLSEVSGYFILSSPMASLSQATPTTVISSPHSLLTQFLFPLQINAIQQWKEFSDYYWESRDQLQDIVDRSSNNIDMLELLSNPSKDQTKAKDLFSNVNQSMKLFPTTTGPTEEQNGDRRVWYLYHVGVYLMKFVQILMKTLDVNSRGNY